MRGHRAYGGRSERRRRGFAALSIYGLILTFLLQGVATQSHFHFEDLTVAGAAHAADADDNQDQDPSHPDRHSKWDCPLWHAANVCGAALPASGLVFVDPSWERVLTPIDQRRLVPERFTAGWRSRAPPVL
jgi:hypothetical protein